MNVITYNKAYSIYPQATFIEQRSLVYNHTEKSFEARHKYEGRGWKQVEYLHAANSKNNQSSFPRGPRRLGDWKCWTIDLLPKIDSRDDFMDSNTWNLDYIRAKHASERMWKIFPTHNWTLLKEPKLFNNTYVVDTERMFNYQHSLKYVEEESPSRPYSTR